MAGSGDPKAMIKGAISSSQHSFLKRAHDSKPLTVASSHEAFKPSKPTMTQSKTTRNQIGLVNNNQSVSSLAEMHKKMPPKVPKLDHGMPIKKLH